MPSEEYYQRLEERKRRREERERRRDQTGKKEKTQKEIFEERTGENADEYLQKIIEGAKKIREEKEKAKKEAIKNVWKTQPEKDAKKIMSGAVNKTKRFSSTINPTATVLQTLNPDRTYATDSVGNTYDTTKDKNTKDMLPQMRGSGKLKNYIKEKKDVNPPTYTKNKQKEKEETKKKELNAYEEQKKSYIKNVKSTLSNVDKNTLSNLEKQTDKQIADLNNRLSKETDKTKKKKIKEQIKQAQDEKQQYKAFGVYKKYGIDVEKFSADDYKKLVKGLSKDENEILWSLAELNYYGNYSKNMGSNPLNPFGTKLLNAGTLGLWDKINNETTKKASQKTGLSGLSNSYAVENEKIEKQHPVQSFTGDFAGGLLAMETVGSFVGAGAKALGLKSGIDVASKSGTLFSKLSEGTKKVLETSATMGLTSRISSAISQDWNKDDWYKQVGNVAIDTITSSAGAFLGSQLSSAVAQKTFVKLRESGLSEKAVKALCATNGALAFSTTTTAVTEQKNALKSIAKGEEYSPDWKNIAENILVAAIYSGISSYAKDTFGGTMKNVEQPFEYFTKEDMKDPAKLKKKYRELSMEYHPDSGGDEAVMQKITAEYTRAKEQCAKYTAKNLKKAYQNTKATAKERETAKNNAVVLLNDFYESSEVTPTVATSNVTENKNDKTAVNVAEEKNIEVNNKNSVVTPLTNEKDSGKIENKELTFSEEQSVMQYKSSESFKINETLRKNSEPTKEETALINNLKSALKKSKPYEGTVYRNICFYSKETFDDFIKEHSGKSKVTYKGFTSTSKDVDGYNIDSNDVPYVAHYEIISHNAKDIEKYGITSEREVLFDTNTEFKINSFEVKDNEIFIKCEESIGNGAEETDRTNQVERNGQQASTDGSAAEHIGVYERVHNDDGILRVGSADNDRILNQESASDGTGNREEVNRYSGNTPQENRNARVSETGFEGLSEQKNVQTQAQTQEAEAETAQKYGFDENFTLNEDGKVVFKQNNIDYDDKTMRSGKFKIVLNNKTAIEKNGYIYGKYGIIKADNGYSITHLMSGYNIESVSDLKEAKQLIIALDELTENMPVVLIKHSIYTRPNAPDGGFDYLKQIRKTINELREKGDYKNIDTYPHKIKDGKVPFENKSQLIEYMKNRVGDKVKVIYPKTGESDIRTIASANKSSYKTTKADGSVVMGFFPEKGKIKIIDTGFSALDELGNTRYTLDFVNVEEQNAQPATQTADNVEKKAVQTDEAPTQTAPTATEAKSTVKVIDTDKLFDTLDNAKEGDTIKLSDYEKKEVTKNGTDETATLDKNDKGYSEVQAQEQTEGVDKTVDTGYTGRQGRLSADTRGNRNLEARAIEVLVEEEKIKDLKTFVGNEINRKTQKELSKKYQEDNRLDNGYELSEVIAYDMLTDESNSLREMFSDNIAEYFNKNIDVTQDITGRKVPTSILKATKNSKIKNKSGQLIPLYHATNKNFDTFEVGDIGFHFGSKAQAISRANDKNIENPTLVKAYLNIENPLYIDEDFFGWNASQIAQKLEKEGIITNEESTSFVKKDSEKGNAELQSLLKEKGYDGIVYKNDKEALNGNSYIVFEDNRILRTDNESVELTFSEKQAVMQYKSSESFLVNSVLRGEDTISAETDAIIQNLKSALVKLPSYSGKVYRNMGFYFKEQFENFIKEHNGEDKVTYKGFTSASKTVDGYNIGKDSMPYLVHYEIESLNAKDIEKYGITSEREVLFDTDTEFKINSFEVKGNEIFIKCEENAKNGHRESSSTDKRAKTTVDGHSEKSQSIGDDIESTGQMGRIRTRDNENDRISDRTPTSNGKRNEKNNDENSVGLRNRNRNADITEGMDEQLVKESENNEKGEKENVHSRVLDTESRRHGNGAISENISAEEKRGNVQSLDRGNRAGGNEQLRQNARATESDKTSAGHLEHSESDTGTNIDKQLREQDDSKGNDRGVHQVSDRKLNKNNYTVSNEIDDVRPSHYKNVEAIKLLKELEESGRKATKEEKAILAGYKGWGGLKDSFLGYENTQLKNLLTEEEYKNARASILNAHYTPTKVIDEMYKGLKRLGFKGDNILEPSMGVGNFFGRMPTAISQKSNLYGVELDSITGRIAKQLYPDADISIMPFQDVKYADNTFDLIITNVPFSDIRYPYKKASYTLHDYFIVKSVDKLKENGIGMFITSSGTLDKLDIKARNEITSKADVIACYRLPNNTFTKNANAQVTTDIIVLQKREKGGIQKGESIENIGNLNGVAINEYYEKHPENVLGKLVYESGPYGERSQVVSDGTDVTTALNKAMKKLPKDLIGGNVELKPVLVEIGENEKSHFIYENNKAYFINAQTKERSTPYGAKRGAVIKDYLDLKNTYNKFLDYHTSNFHYTHPKLAEVKKSLTMFTTAFLKSTERCKARITSFFPTITAL